MPEQIHFADKNARIAWTIRKRIAAIVKTMTIPAEHPHMSACSIRFSKKYLTRGTYAILFSGTVVGADRQGEFIVPERTLLILKKLHIPFIRGSSQ